MAEGKTTLLGTPTATPERSSSDLHIKIFKRRVCAELLPFWGKTGFLQNQGVFSERLDFTGCPIREVPHRAMVQARQIYVFAHAAVLGIFPEGASLARKALSNLLDRYTDEGGVRNGFAFSLNLDGRIASSVRDSYTHAFILLALAWCFRLTQDRQLLRIADATILFIESFLVDKSRSGLFDRYPVESRQKRQNPLMHLLEAYLAWHVAEPSGPYIEKAGAIVDLFKTRLFQPDLHVLLEHFDEDWSAHPDQRLGRVFEPGHHFEWVWLLDWYGRLVGADVSEFAEPLYAVAREHGLGASGLCFDEVFVDRSPARCSHRLWPHAEGAKAAAVRFASRQLDSADFAEAMAAALNQTFLGTPFAAGWIDHLASDGTPLVDFVPASSLYHIFGAFSELSRVFADAVPGANN
jgi:mannose/cellobiose epimerase-like protein (N-acyl-D-glucosamine 2-epimerase family)